MTDGTRILRTVGFPAGIAVLVLVFVPRMCSRANRAEGVAVAAAAAADGGTPADSTTSSPAGALHISTTSPDAPPFRSPAYPPGLNAERVQYLIEVDPTFSAPFTMRVPKNNNGLSNGAETVFLFAVRHSGLFQLVDGSYSPTREAALHLDGMSEDSAGWVVPVGKRAYVRLTALEDLGEGRYRATFRWTWEPNTVGAALLSKPAIHEAAAEFSGGERHWALMQMTGLDQPFE